MSNTDKIFKPRRGTKNTFTNTELEGNKSNIVLDTGEIFFEVPDTGQGSGRVRLKMGDGITEYSSLPYAIPFTEDEIIVHNGTDDKTISASSSIQSSAIATNLNNAKSGNTLKTIVHNLREAIYKSACDIAKLGNDLGGHTIGKDVPNNAVFTDTTYTGATLKTNTVQNGSSQSSISNSIAANTSMNNAIGTLLNNDATLNSSLTNLTWQTSTAGFKYVKFPNGFIYGYKDAKLSSGSTKGTLYPNSFYGGGNYSISDIGFSKTCLAYGDVLGAYMLHIKLECAAIWNRSQVTYALFTDNANSQWDCRITIMGF